VILLVFFSCGILTRFGVMASPYGSSRSYLLDTPLPVALLWTSDQPDLETSTWQHTTLTRDRNPWRRWDSNLQFQEASGRRLTP